MKPAVLITGASSGIGEACAVHLANLGWQVFAGVRKTSDGEALQAKTSNGQILQAKTSNGQILQAKTGQIIPVILDVTNEASIVRAVKEISAATPTLSGLVNNAGMVVAGPLEFLPLEELRRQLEVNVIGQVAMYQAVMPLIRAARGRIVNMSSISGKVAAPLFAPYSASKYALEALSDSMRRELAPWGIEVSIIEPGNINTPIWQKGVAWGREMISKLPSQAQELYGPRLEQLLEFVGSNLGKGTSPIQVARVVEHALTAPRPRTRYVVGNDAKLAILLLRILPDRLVDRFLLARRQGRKE